MTSIVRSVLFVLIQKGPKIPIAIGTRPTQTLRAPDSYRDGLACPPLCGSPIQCWQVGYAFTRWLHRCEVVAGNPLPGWGMTFLGGHTDEMIRGGTNHGGWEISSMSP